MPEADDLVAPTISAPLGPVTTKRLELRRFRPEDLDALAGVFANEAVWTYPYGRGLSRDETATFLAGQMRHWDEVGFGLWLATERTTGATAGYIGLSVPSFLPEILPAVEVGWRLDPAVWGRGYASEGGRAALEQAFETLGLEEVCSLPQADNLASVRVAEGLGLRLDRRVMVPGNERRGSLEALVFEITRDEWRAQNA